VADADLAERAWISRYSMESLGLLVHRSGVLSDPDDNAVLVDMIDESTSQPVFTAFAAERVSEGTYSVELSTAETANPGYYRLVWRFEINGAPQSEETFVEVGQSAPDYDALPDAFKGVVNNVWWRFADLFDSPQGGPHLQVYFQTQMGRGRIAQIMRSALGRINLVSQPHQTYVVPPTEGAEFPLGDWGGLLELATYIEVVKHLIRSYTEQPSAEGVTTARLDRRDYADRWRAVLQMEMDDYKDMLDHYKIAHMGLSTSPRVLVSGGVYGSYGPTRLAGSAASRPRMWARFY
jgi:hypothetical protein